jgi:hypothetical protein
MKTRTRALEARLMKLEAGHLPVRFVVRLSHEEWELPEVEKQRLIAERSGGRPVMVCPDKCATAEEWKARYALH